MAIHSSVLLGESHGQRSLVGYSPCSRKESGMNGVTWCGVYIYIYIYIFQCRILASKGSQKQKLFCHYILQRSSSEEDQDWDWGLLTSGLQFLNLVLRWPKDSGSPLDTHPIKTDPRQWGTK